MDATVQRDLEIESLTKRLDTLEEELGRARSEAKADTKVTNKRIDKIEDEMIEVRRAVNGLKEKMSEASVQMAEVSTKQDQVLDSTKNVVKLQDQTLTRLWWFLTVAFIIFAAAFGVERLAF
ncbi:hypothetical protein [Geomicrobium sp. JCM 19039]|uniref:hypothetical protein n=1 Tax=Geomicrobium sp. JCM 19039 TaxID=1460636 RepID=UPI00045F1556|nr:hypothetical protein [Geomicrobium sp. JCM 19039]GAK12254.1 hypothetical protein JCM19039_2009 [Geomicrobium sp. JCM 19039]